MTIDITDLATRRVELYENEPLFRQQEWTLAKIGKDSLVRAASTKVACVLYNLDMIVWDESERWLKRFAEDFANAHDIVGDLIISTEAQGNTLGMQSGFVQIVAAFTLTRIFAGGKNLRKEYERISNAIVESYRGKEDYELFAGYCQLICENKYDPVTGKEVTYRRGDPLDWNKNKEKEQ